MSQHNPEDYFALTHACKHCPFRTDIQQYLESQRKEDIAAALRRGEEFVCHKTVDYSDTDSDEKDLETNDGQDNARACAGARSVTHKQGIVSQMEQIATRLGFSVPQPVNTNPTYDSLEEWINDGDN